MRTKRLLMLFGSICLILALVVPMAACAGEAPRPEKTFKLVGQCVFGGYDPTDFRNELYWVPAVEEATNGRITVDYYHSGELMDDKAAFEAVDTGKLDFVIACSGHIAAGSTAIGEWATVPGASIDAMEHYLQVWEKGIFELENECYKEKCNTICLFQWHPTPLCLYLKKGMPEVKNVEDLPGLKIRAFGGLTVVVPETLGIKTVSMMPYEVYSAVERGTIDGMITATHNGISHKFFEVCEYVYPEIIGTCPIRCWLNLDKFNELGPELQDILLAESRKWERANVEWGASYATECMVKANAMGVKFSPLFTLGRQAYLDMVAPAAWDWYIKTNAEQGFEKQARQVKEIITAGQ